MTDVIEGLIAQWNRVRPELEPRPMRTSGRLLRLGKQLERAAEAVLKPYGLTLWQFDVLATLRRHGRDLSPGELLGSTMLTSGAMTHRLDRLEKDGYIERRPDAADRRGVRVHLTLTGRRLVDRAVKGRFDEAARIEALLEPKEADELARLLRKLEQRLSDSSRS